MTVARPGLACVVMAAGKGVRMRSAVPKVLHEVQGRPMLEWVLMRARALEPERIAVVIGAGADAIRDRMSEWDDEVDWVMQEEQLGTGHAVAQTRSVCEAEGRQVLILSGDVPLLTEDTLRAFRDAHEASEACLSLLGTTVDDPTGYGRVLRDAENRLLRVVEHRDANEAERAVKEINTGIYLVDATSLYRALDGVGNENDQGEYYLPDVVPILQGEGASTQAVVLGQAEEFLGVNDRQQLARVAELMRERTARSLMAGGVTLQDPRTTYVDEGVEVGRDTVLEPNVVLSGQTRVGACCVIGFGSVLRDVILADGVTLAPYTVAEGASVESGASVGPFSRLRTGAQLGPNTRVGNFVEIKKSRLGEGSKASHLAYIGDATIGAGCNIGAGTITCNYDGINKNPTVLGDEVFIGSNATLVAPCTVGDRGYVAAGSTVNMEVPGGALAIGRARQVNKEGYRDRLEARFQRLKDGKDKEKSR